MRNPFQRPEAIQRYLKIAVKGKPDSGKTVFGLLARVHGLGPTYIVSNEGGDVHYLRVPDWKPDFRLPTQDISEFKEGVTHLKHNVKGGTLIIDTATGLYQQMVSAKMDEETGDIALPSWAPIKRLFRDLMVELVNLPMNIVWVVHVDENAKMKGREIEITQKDDIEKSFMRNPDVVLELVKENGKRYAIVHKDRTKDKDGKPLFASGQRITDPHIGMWAGAVIADGAVEKQLTSDALHAVNADAMGGMLTAMFAELAKSIPVRFAGAEEASAWKAASTDKIKALPKEKQIELGELWKAAAAPMPTVAT